MPTLHPDVIVLLRQDHRATIYGSFLKPLTLWFAQVHSSVLNRADTLIPFNNGGGSHWAAIEPFQEVWVGTTPGTYDITKLRIKDVNTTDGGVTGAVTVQPNNVIWQDDWYLTFKHNYPFMAMYPFIDTDEVFYKDTDITYNDENSDPSPVVVAELFPRAQRLKNNYAVVYINAAGSYAIKNGASIVSYTCSVYPTTGTTLTFNGGTGVGYLEVTSSNPDYRWLKFTVTDSNGKSQDSWRCVFIHGENGDDTNYPHTDFEAGQISGNWENGGWMMSLTVHDDADIANIPDGTFACIWKEREFGNVDKNVINVDNVTFYNPKLSFRVVAGAPCTITATFHAGILINGSPDNGTNISITINAPGGASDTQAANSSDGTLDIPGFSLAGANCSGSMTVIYAGTTILTVPYRQGWVVNNASEYGARIAAYPQEMIVGYIRGEKLTFNDAQGAGDDTIEISTIEGLLKNEYMFSISLAARPDGDVGEWYEYAKWLTIGRACHHIWKWHSTLLEVADVAGLLDNTDGRAYAEFENGTLYTMPDTMARQHGIRAHVVCSKRGRVYLTQDVQLLLDADRAALNTVMTVTEDDYHHLSLSRQPDDRVALVYGSGLAFNESFSVDETGENQPDVDPYCSLAPGSKPSGMGEGVINFERQVLTGQVQLNQLTGRVYAQANNLYPDLRLDMSGDYLDMLDFHLVEFWEIDIATTDTIKELAVPDLKLIPRDISATINVDTGDIETHVTFEPEMPADPGVTSECPGPPSDLGGAIPPIPTSDGLPGAIVSASSVYYLPPDSSNWDLRSNDATEDLIQDPFWRTTQGSTGSGDAILWRCGVGYIKRSDDAGQTWSVVTPSTDPPNDAGDGTPPTVANVTFKMIEGSYIYNQEFVALANWQNGGGDWRSWLAYTGDDGATWSWKYLGGQMACSNPDITKYDMTGAVDFDVARGAGESNNSLETVIETGTDEFVVSYFDGATPGLFVQAFTINPSTNVITWGTRQQVSAAVSASRISLARAGDNKFILYFGQSTIVGTVAGLTITLGSSADIRTATEISNSVLLGRGRVLNPGGGSQVVWVGIVRTLNLSCTLRAERGLYVLEGSISGTTITWNDAACNGNTVRDWVVIDYAFGWTPPTPHTGTIRVIDHGATHWIVLYEDQNNDEHYVIAGIGTVFGSPVALPTTVTDSALLINSVLIPLDAGQCVVVYGLYDQLPGSQLNIYGSVISRGGTTITIGDETKIADGPGVDSLEPRRFDPIVVDADDEFAFECENADPDDTCYSIFRFKVVGDSFFLLDSCRKFRHITVEESVSFGWSSARFAHIAMQDYADVDDPYGTTYAFPLVCVGTGDCLGAGLSIAKGLGDGVWVTIGDNTNLELLAVALPSLAIVARYELGAATWAQMLANTYIAYPFSLFGDDNEVYIAGRMNAPQGLANPEHVIGTADGGASFASIENTWGTDWCGCMYVTPGGLIIAIRNDGSSSKLYTGDALGLTLMSTSIIAAGVSWKAIALDFIDATIILGNDTGGTFMVVATVPPYLDWYDLTSDHPIGAGINALELL